MSFRDRFKSKMSSLQKQNQHQKENKDRARPSIINRSKLPPGMEMWNPKEGKHAFEVIPFPAGPDMPIDTSTMEVIVEEGDLAYIVDVQVHQNIGANNMQYVCPSQNFGEPCPICEFMKANELDKDDWKKLTPKRRVVYLVWVVTTREDQKKGLQLYETSFFNMQEKILAVAETPDGGGIIDFAHPDKGKTVGFQRKGSGKDNTQFLGHRLMDRANKIPDALLDRAEKIQLDQLIKMRPTYEEIEAAFKGQKSSLSTTEDVEESGNAFGSTEDDGTPDWMKDEEEVKAPPKKKLFLKKR